MLCSVCSVMICSVLRWWGVCVVCFVVFHVICGVQLCGL